MADINLNEELNVKEFNAELKKTLGLVDEFIKSIDSLNTSVQKGSGITKANNDAQKKRATALSELDKLENQQAKSIEKLVAADSQNAKSVQRVKQEIQAKNKLVQQEVKLEKVASDSLTAKRIKLAQMKKEYADSSAVQRGKLLPALKAQNDEVKKLEKAYGDNQRNVGNYKDSLSSLTGQMGGTIGGFRMMVMQAKAFIATPIGLVLAAVAGAVALIAKAFKSSQPLMDAFNRTSKAIGAALAVVTDRIASFMENLSNGKTTLKDVGKSLVTNILNRFRAIAEIGGNVGKIVGNVLTGNFKKAGEEAKALGKNYVQLMTGLDEEQQKKAAESFKSITKEIKEETKAASDLEAQRQKLRDEENASLTTLAQLNQEIQKNRLLAKDQTKSDEERLASLKAAQAAEIERADIAVRLATERARIAAEEVALGKSTAEEIRESEELKAAAIDARTESYRTQQRILSELSGFEKTIAAEREKAFQDEEDAFFANIEAELDAEKNRIDAKINLSNEELEEAQDKADKLLEISKKRILDEEVLEEEKLRYIQALGNQLTDFGIALGDRRIANIEEQVEAGTKTEEEGAREIAKIKRRQAIADKAASLFDIAINTAVAVSKVYGQTGIFGLAAEVPILVMGALQAATVLAQPIPQFKNGVEGFGGGLAVVGDGGESEMVVQSGGVWMSPPRPTLIDLEKGASVYNQKQLAEGKHLGNNDVSLLKEMKGMRSDMRNRTPLLTQKGIARERYFGNKKVIRINKFRS